ncbi:hypothetical protein CDL12_24606 [Handroanthus impetiginosus]|uniref:Uncharacterized protein n=1 Tax=Handroanthus impetiginosus TaxID=429701 RepID=A0A2G9GCF1_9LAMI|nr:hypothetical protein CDL12_24606 [Handroanthus impetiginosus]
MLSKKTLVITLTWLLLVTYLVTCSCGPPATETVVHPQGCRCCLFDFSKPLITCVKACCMPNCC